MCSVPLILDVQGFLDDGGEMIPKEIAWITADFSIMVHIFTTPVRPWNRLTERAQTINTWLTENVHGLQWTSTGVEKECVQRLWLAALRRAPTIYVTHSSAGRIVSYEDQKKVKVLHVSLRSTDPGSRLLNVCRVHQNLNPNFQCALANVCQAAQFLNKSRIPNPLPENATPNTEGAIATSESWEVRVPKYPLFRNFQLRKASFSTWKNPHMPYMLLALSGFFHSGDGDKVICYACGAELGLWLPRDHVQARHRQKSPDCVVANRVGL